MTKEYEINLLKELIKQFKDDIKFIEDNAYEFANAINYDYTQDLEIREIYLNNFKERLKQLK